MSTVHLQPCSGQLSDSQLLKENLSVMFSRGATYGGDTRLACLLSSVLKIEAICFSDKFVNFYQTTRSHIPEDIVLIIRDGTA